MSWGPTPLETWGSPLPTLLYGHSVILSSQEEMEKGPGICVALSFNSFITSIDFIGKGQAHARPPLLYIYDRDIGIGVPTLFVCSQSFTDLNTALVRVNSWQHGFSTTVLVSSPCFPSNTSASCIRSSLSSRWDIGRT